jgi:N-acyl-D-glutamate deacylase
MGLITRCIFLYAILLVCGSLHAQEYDLVISSGRVIDPETNLDGIRNIGINGGKISAVSEEPLTGKVELDANGLIVAPGFIDFHAHGQRIDVFGQREGI